MEEPESGKLVEKILCSRLFWQVYSSDYISICLAQKHDANICKFDSAKVETYADVVVTSQQKLRGQVFSCGTAVKDK